MVIIGWEIGLLWLRLLVGRVRIEGRIERRG
ncbi:hypothetical protein GLYMA_04G023133v4 [Glycine max]|nr:hypothetical protein GLYMA_04G023133v4 [Glycine max]KAH1109419.1 hypothetical protein GYH30_008702 [Glycine max]